MSESPVQKELKIEIKFLKKDRQAEGEDNKDSAGWYVKQRHGRKDRCEK